MFPTSIVLVVLLRYEKIRPFLTKKVFYSIPFEWKKKKKMKDRKSFKISKLTLEGGEGILHP